MLDINIVLQNLDYAALCPDLFTLSVICNCDFFFNISIIEINIFSTSTYLQTGEKKHLLIFFQALVDM